MPQYIGRFAPSPTGPLHIGSLTAALASYLDAKAHQGQWLLRMEDLDPPRELTGASQAILDTLVAHGLHWDGQLLWQSQRLKTYQQVVEQLLSSHKAFYCYCSRSDLLTSNGIHNGHCSGHQELPNQAFTIRLKMTDKAVDFEDGIYGHFSQHLQREIGDVVLKRKDGLFAYQLAVVVDDAYQNISHCVRGSDLLDSTPRQIFLQQALGLTTPHYFHIPVITNSRGQKLSKQTFAKPLKASSACDNLLTVLAFLNQRQPPVNCHQQVEGILDWAVSHWSRQDLSNATIVTKNPKGL